MANVILLVIHLDSLISTHLGNIVWVYIILSMVNGRNYDVSSRVRLCAYLYAVLFYVDLELAGKSSYVSVMYIGEE